MLQTIDISKAGTYKIGGEIEINRMGFGAMRIVGKGVWGEPEDRNEAIATLKRAVELGVNFIDTADSYGPFISEDLICEALYPYPSSLLIGTKGGHTRHGPDIWRPIGSPDYLRQCVLMSMRRLKLNEIRFWQLHRVAEDTPAEVQFEAIAKMQQEGLICHVGLSAVGIKQIEKAQQFFKVVSVQNKYNLINRESEAVVQYCQDNNIAFIPYAPLDQGEFTQGDVLKEIMKSKHATARQVALAWLLKRGDFMIPIPGTGKVMHLEENVAAANIGLSDAEYKYLSQEGAEIWGKRKNSVKLYLKDE
ncbi:aldo/keto reductase [Commensalibacter papalotli (ex Servin-Garciduenas et al. 2014)]|uniref:Aldo/keto reductase n=1 Tax=Commensalibacter papalotli (ex Servin-Garciduenas et al. 2014) TaxID=1208583 RepID=W7DYY5_9PROT|nr:aldo/keto reductase [Commensalibacter papalotli (ex Servin-Garciduenas et al. 2014)]EUK19218.1 aldo/keto reductase [Commensalibacter papalotli (ex Servin-Garciduenas et al. 2014)]